MTIKRTTLVFIGSLWLLTSCGGGNGGAVPVGNGEAAAGSSSTLGGKAEVTVNPQKPAIARAIPTSEVNNAASDGPLGPKDAYRLLEQATFGPTLDDIVHAGRLGTDAWINEQMQMPASFISDGLTNGNNEPWNEYVNVWWRRTIKSDDQLRHRVAFALSQILVVSALDGLDNEQAGLANYYDILLRHAFGNYRDLLEDVTLNPLMGQYLSMKGNRKPAPEENIQPDENYAREVLQLFSIGQVLLNDDGTPKLDAGGVPLPAYDQSTIQNFARVFTGWQFGDADNFHWPSTKNFLLPMRPWEEFHDTDAKVLLNGFEVAAGMSAEQELKVALDNIFSHPNVGPFISKQLIQRLVTSNPSPEYVRDVAQVFNNNQAGERGSLASTIKAILAHKEARYGHLDNPDTYGKLKEPIIRITQIWRAFEPENIPDDFSYAWAHQEIGQSPLNSPSVFNFFRPEFSQPGEIRDSGLVSPEFQIIDETSIIKITSRLVGNTIWSHNFKNDPTGKRIAIDITKEMELEPDIDDLLDHLDLLMLGGRMSSELRLAVNNLIDSTPGSSASDRVVEAIFLIASSPEAAVQR